MKVETIELSAEQKYVLSFPANSSKAYKDAYTEKFKQMLLNKEVVLAFPDDIKLIVFK